MPTAAPGTGYLPSACSHGRRMPISAGDVAVTVTPGNTAPLRIRDRAGETSLSDLCERGRRVESSCYQRDDEPCRSRSHRGPPLKNQTIAGHPDHELLR